MPRSELINAFLDFLLPHDCLLCGQEMSGGQICANCRDYLPVVGSPFCRRCGRPVKKEGSCHYCRKQTHVERGRAWMLFVPPADRLMYHFKYRNKRRLARIFGRALSLIIKSDHELAQSELIIPVPLHWWKKARRGYNQAMLIAREIGRDCGIDVADILRRSRHTRTQTRLDLDQRRENVANAFVLKKHDLKDRRLLLVDDVMTTGATINECRRVLLAAGARSVGSCVAAITPG